METNKRIFALGFFDGVHLGHQALLRRCRALADEMGCEAAAITFDRHPKSLFLSPAPVLISAGPDRQRLLCRYGMDRVYTLPVTAESMAMPWEEFLRQLLRDGAAGFVCGHDFRFGARGAGNTEILQSTCEKLGIPCVVVPEQTLDGVRISSSHIRNLIEDGKMESATKFLGHPYLLTGTVVRGHQLGRKLGFPTANLVLPGDLAIPKFGVYACRAVVDGAAYPAVTNIGTRPTVSGEGITVEPWILDFSGDLYDREITLEIYRFLRPEMKFSGLEDLRRQVRQDAADTRVYLEGRL